MAIEIPTVFPFMDSAAYGDGQPGSSHRRREMILGNNRLVTRGGEALHLLANANTTSYSSEDGDLGYFRGYGSPAWQPLCMPFYRPKKAGLDRLSLRAHFVLPWNTLAFGSDPATRQEYALQLQVETSVMPFRADTPIGTDRCVELRSDASGNVQVFSLNNIPVSPGSQEFIRFWIRGGLTRVLMDTASYGANNSGTVSNATGIVTYGGHGVFDSGSNWSNVHRGGHYAEFSGIPGQFLVVETSPTLLTLSPEPMQGTRGQQYSIFRCAEWRLTSLAGYYSSSRV